MDNGASVVISAIHRHICNTVNIVINFFIPALICKYFFTLNLYLFILCPLISIGF